MARVSIRFPSLEVTEVEITIHASAGELRDYVKHMSPSYPMGYRLHEAIHAALAQLLTKVEAPLAFDDMGQKQ